MWCVLVHHVMQKGLDRCCCTGYACNSFIVGEIQTVQYSVKGISHPLQSAATGGEAYLTYFLLTVRLYEYEVFRIFQMSNSFNSYLDLTPIRLKSYLRHKIGSCVKAYAESRLFFNTDSVASTSPLHPQCCSLIYGGVYPKHP